MPSIDRCGHVRMRWKVHTALLATNDANLPRTSRPVNRSHNTAVNRDRWRRYGAFVASVAERARHGANYNPLSERTIQNPYPVYARLRRHSPVHRSVILGSWILSRYDDVLAVARDHERFSNDPRWRNATASGLPPAPDDYSILLVDPSTRRLDMECTSAFAPNSPAWRPVPSSPPQRHESSGLRLRDRSPATGTRRWCAVSRASRFVSSDDRALRLHEGGWRHDPELSPPNGCSRTVAQRSNEALPTPVR